MSAPAEVAEVRARVTTADGRAVYTLAGPSTVARVKVARAGWWPFCLTCRRDNCGHCYTVWTHQQSHPIGA